VALLLITSQIHAQTGTEIPIKLNKLNDRILFIKTGDTSVLTNVLAVSTKEGIIVFDATWHVDLARRVKEIIEKEFGRNDFAYLILTHAAFDHTTGNQEFSEAVIIGHDIIPSRMEVNAKRVQEQGGFFYQSFQNAKDRLEDVKKGSLEEKETNEFIAAYTFLLNELSSPDFILTPPDITFNDRLTLRLGDLTLHMVHNTPSYSDNDIITYIPELKLLNVGDIFNNDRLPWISRNSDIPKWLEIFKVFTDKEGQIVYVIGGHGGLLTLTEVKEHLEYVNDLWEGIKSAKADGMTLKEIRHKFSFEEFNHLNHINPVIPGWRIDMHAMNIQNIWRMLGTNK
jgi:glyoxylase-like metal-dependent hydrolase (beta-lactamase superfamily II)